MNAQLCDPNTSSVPVTAAFFAYNSLFKLIWGRGLDWQTSTRPRPAVKNHCLLNQLWHHKAKFCAFSWIYVVVAQNPVEILLREVKNGHSSITLQDLCFSALILIYGRSLAHLELFMKRCILECLKNECCALLERKFGAKRRPRPFVRFLSFTLQRTF